MSEKNRFVTFGSLNTFPGAGWRTTSIVFVILKSLFGTWSINVWIHLSWHSVMSSA